MCMPPPPVSARTVPPTSAARNIAADGFQLGGSAHRADLILPAPLRTAQPAAHRADPDIAAAGDKFAIAANAVHGEFAGAPVSTSSDPSMPLASTAPSEVEITTLVQARRLHRDCRDHRTAGRGAAPPIRPAAPPARYSAA